jgi:hypothetical protein
VIRQGTNAFPESGINSWLVNEFQIETLRLTAISGTLKRSEDVHVGRPPSRRCQAYFRAI